MVQGNTTTPSSSPQTIQAAEPPVSIHITQPASGKDPLVLAHKHSRLHGSISLDHQKTRLSRSGGEGGMFTWRWVQGSAWGNRLSFEVQVSINVWWSHTETRSALFGKPAAFVIVFSYKQEVSTVIITPPSTRRCRGTKWASASESTAWEFKTTGWKSLGHREVRSPQSEKKNHIKPVRGGDANTVSRGLKPGVGKNRKERKRGTRQ